MRFMSFAAVAASAVALSFAAAPASATTVYNVVNDFSGPVGGAQVGVWRYGWNDGSGFAEADSFNTSCIVSGMQCWQAAVPQYFVPLIGKNITADTISYANTVVHPTDVLNLHPGGTDNAGISGGGDIDAVVRFIAPKAGTYKFTGFFQALDTNPTGVSILANNTPVNISGHATINSPVSTSTVGAPTPFNFFVTLNEDGFVDFVVNRGPDHNFGNDSTGLALAVAVPEPATWGLMIMGFGGIGAALRSSRRRNVAATA